MPAYRTEPHARRLHGDPAPGEAIPGARAGPTRDQRRASPARPGTRADRARVPTRACRVAAPVAAGCGSTSSLGRSTWGARERCRDGCPAVLASVALAAFLCGLPAPIVLAAGITARRRSPSRLLQAHVDAAHVAHDGARRRCSGWGRPSRPMLRRDSTRRIRHADGRGHCAVPAMRTARVHDLADPAR